MLIARRHWSVYIVLLWFASYVPSAHSLDINWNGSGGLFGDPESWQNVDNWDPAGSPFQVQRVPGDNDTAILSSPADDTVRLDANTEPIDGISILNGITLDTDSHTLIVDNGGFAGTGVTTIAGEGSRLKLDAFTLDFTPGLVTDNLLVTGGGRIDLLSGSLFVEGNASLFSGSMIANFSQPFQAASTLSIAGDLTIVDSSVELDNNDILFLGGENQIVLRENALWRSEKRVTIPESGSLDIRDSTWETGTTVLGTMLLGDNSNLVASGTRIDGGQMEIAASAIVPVEHTYIAQNDGMVSSARDLTLAGASAHRFESGADLQLGSNELELVGGSTSGNGGLTLEGQGTTLNAGRMAVTASGFDAVTTLSVQNEAIATVDVMTVSSSTASANGRLVIDSGGLLTVSDAIDVGVGGSGEMQLLGTGRVVADIVNVIGDGSFLFEGGTLSVMTFNGDLENAGGTMAPGSVSGGPDAAQTSVTGDYSQSMSSLLSIDVGGTTVGTDFDFVDVAGDAALDGDLLLNLIGGYQPTSTETFTIFNANSLVGTFQNIANGQRLDTSDGGGSFVVNYGVTSPFDPDQIVLSDFQATTDADFDNDGDVDGTDFLLIQRNNPSLIPLWQSQYGANPLAASVAVPEPTAFSCLVVSAVMFSLLTRRESRL